MKLKRLVNDVKELFELLIQQSEKYKDLFVARLYAFTISNAIFISGLWFGAYAESLADDMITLHAAGKL